LHMPIDHHNIARVFAKLDLERSSQHISSTRPPKKMNSPTTGVMAVGDSRTPDGLESQLWVGMRRSR
jgi:hypothetical protein